MKNGEVRYYNGMYRVQITVPCGYNELDCPDEGIPCAQFKALEDFISKFRVHDIDENGNLTGNTIEQHTHYWIGRKGCCNVTKLWKKPLIDTIELEEIVWGDNFQKYYEGGLVYPGVDGAVKYIITIKGHKWTHYQPFKKGKSYTQSNNRIVWGWDGNIPAPTLTPSFGLRHHQKGFTVHLHFIKGKIHLLNSSKVKLKEK